MILKDYATTVAGLEVESSNNDHLLDASTGNPDAQNQESDSFHSSRITDLSAIISVSTTSVVPASTQDANDATTDVSLLSKGVVATSVISQTEAAVSQIRASYPSSLTFAVKSSKIVSTLIPTQDSTSHRASSVTFNMRTDSKLAFLKSNPATTSAPQSMATASDVQATLSHDVEKINSTSSEVDLSTVTELSTTVKPTLSSELSSTVKPTLSSSQSSTDVASITYGLSSSMSSLSSSMSLDVTEVVSSATSLSAPDGVATQTQSRSLVSHFDGRDSTSQNVLINSLQGTDTSAVSTTDSFTTSSFVSTDFPTTTTTLVKSSSSQPRSVSTDQTTTWPILETSTASEKLTTDGRTSSKRQEKVTSVHVVSSPERQDAESTVIPKTNFPFHYDSQSLRLDPSWITSEHSSSNYTTSAKVNGSIDSTAVASGSVGVALYVSLSLVFGLGVILVISFVVLCLLRNYCRQFHRCCSKHPGRCRFKNSCPCVETCPYHGLHPQRLTETPDLISESVHAQITRIRRGSSHPDEIALLERSLEHSDSLNELDQFVFEDPDLMTPSSSDLFVDCRLASACDHTPELSTREFSEDPSDMSRSSRSNRSGRPRKNIMGACFGAGSGAYNFARPSRCDFQDDGFGCGGGHDAIVVENPYLKPSCHAHVDPGPNWMPFHPYDPVYVPHHDPIGMARRLDKEGKYVTSPRLRMRNQVYEELGRNVRDQYRAPVNRLPPVVPNRSSGAALGGFVPVVPTRVSSRQSPRVPVRGASLERSAKSPPVAPMRISSRASPVVPSKSASSLERKFRGNTAQVAPIPVALPPSPPSGATFNEGPAPSSRVGSRAVVDPLLDRCLPELPVAQHGREPSMLSVPGSQRDSTSSSTTIPGHEYSRVDFGNREQPDPVVTTAEVEPYETDSDSCRDGAYESIDFPKSPPSP